VLHWHSDKHDCGFPGCSHDGHGEHGHDDLVGPPAVPVLDISGTVTGWTRTGLNAADPLVNVPLPGLEVVVAGVGTAITDSTGAFSIPSTLTSPVSVTVNMNGVHCTLISGASAPTSTQLLTPGTPGSFQLLTQAAPSADAAHTSTYWWVYTANEWIRTILGNSSQMATADNIHPTVNIASTCNAYYTGNTINFYAAGGSCNNTGFSTVVAHEWGHGIDDRYGGISNASNDGLSEAWGDTIAMFLVGDPEIGRGFNVGATTGIRRGTNTRQWPTISTLTDPHAAGECYMGFCWKVRDRLITTQGAGPGVAIANTIVIGSIIANATNQTNAVREIFIADDNDGNLLNGVPHYAELTYAANIHAMPFPAIQVGTIAHTPLGSTSVQLTPRVANATVTPLSGSFTDIRLHYNDGTGAQSRSMLPNGLPNGYRALLPGVIAPGAVTYHFEAQHISGPLLRLPATGEYSTVTGGPETRLFFDDFETGGPGWTHGWVSVEDDWQIATPLGFSGTSGGVAWRDPSAAYSGVNCAGNDLRTNGSYRASVQNWLHTPLLNTTGSFGCKLRFRRWLSVEEATYDQAQIRVNNVVVWQNPVGVHTVDTVWQFIELPIPQADNNPAVTIEWRLIADAGLQLGGWTIDDVEVVAVGPLQPLDAQLRVTPAMGPVGGPLNLGLAIRPNTPFILALGDTAGPTSIPGIPTMQVGGNYVTLPGWTDGAGNFNYGFTGPGVPSMINAFWYSQALTLDPAFNFVTSNAWLNLFSN
jgi:hypothetical protein